MTKHELYLLKHLTYKVSEPWFWHQCVGMNKSYAKEAQGVSLGSFNWQANKATYKAGWTYDPKYWIRYIPWPWNDLKQGDHLIQNFLKTWHIGIVHKADAEGYFLLAQNDGELNKKTWGNGDGKGDNAIMLRYFKWSDRPIKEFYRRK